MRITAFVMSLASIALAPPLLAAQKAPAGAAAKPATQAVAQPAAPPSGSPTPPPVPDGYAYRADNRRDPFVGLVGTGTDVARPGKRVEGPGGLLTGEISVRGVVESRGMLIAMIMGPDRKTYVIHSGDKLMDGVVRTVTPQGLVIVQDVSDPLSLVKQREVHKLLRSLEEAKE